jgi:hypothetical protein
VSGNHSAFHAQFRIQDAINARLEEISFRKGVAVGTSALLFLAGLGVVTAELAGQANPASGALSGQAGGAPAVTPPQGLASAPSSAAPSHPPRRTHAQSRPSSRPSSHPSSRPSSHPAVNRSGSVPVSTTSVPGRSPGTGGVVRAPAPAVSAIPPGGSRPDPGSWWRGGRDRDGWHHGDQGWNGWGPGGGDPWHGGHHW